MARSKSDLPRIRHAGVVGQCHATLRRASAAEHSSAVVVCGCAISTHSAPPVLCRIARRWSDAKGGTHHRAWPSARDQYPPEAHERGGGEGRGGMADEPDLFAGVVRTPAADVRGGKPDQVRFSQRAFRRRRNGAGLAARAIRARGAKSAAADAAAGIAAAGAAGAAELHPAVLLPGSIHARSLPDLESGAGAATGAGVPLRQRADRTERRRASCRAAALAAHRAAEGERHSPQKRVSRRGDPAAPFASAIVSGGWECDRRR
jgi:hypothetical protein